MPHKKLTSAPSTMMSDMPQHALKLYLAEFNKVWNAGADESARQSMTELAERAHRFAWEEVKKTYGGNPENH